jgi:hypothetical protein
LFVVVTKLGIVIVMVMILWKATAAEVVVVIDFAAAVVG